MQSRNSSLFLLNMALAFFFSLNSIAYSQDSLIRVHLISGNSVRVGNSGKLLLCQGETTLLTISGGNTFSLKDGKFLIGESPSSLESFFLIPEKKGDILYVNGKAYRGVIELKLRDPGKFLVINRVDIEDYLAGVLGGEVSASWPEEALKAQAVAARSYVLYKKKQPRDQDFDVYSTTMDQVYAGVIGESSELLRIVKETRGQVLLHGEEVVKAYYHSTCGGHTEDGVEVFPEDGAFLRGVPCEYCKGSPCYYWEKALTTREIAAAIAKKGMGVGDFLDLKVTRWDKSKRAAEMFISGSQGDTTIRGAEMRMMIGPGQLKSTRFTMKVLDRKSELIHTYSTTWKKRMMSVAFQREPFMAGFALAQCGLVPDSPESKMELMPQYLDDPFTVPVRTRSDILIRRIEDVKEKVTALYFFSGEGWGHGVGMCQWGAFGMAKEGFDYAQILHYYYPETQLMQIASGND